MTMRNWTTRLAHRLGGTRPLHTASAGAAILAGGMMFAGSASAATLLSENFDSLALTPFVSRLNGDGTDFTEALPAGWTRDNTTTPVPLVSNEYFGGQVFDIDSWIAEATPNGGAPGGQDRKVFTKGGVGAHGQVLVFDGDQFDDTTGIEPDLFNSFITTSSISLAGVTANNVSLNFDSSFRPYDAMVGLVDVSFDNGATFTNLLTLNGANSGGDSSLSRANESISLPISNPAGGSMRLRFALTKTGNDWWWALDNVHVFTRDADVNGDGKIDLADFDVIRANFYTGDALDEGDVNLDGIVNEVDFRLWKDAFGGGGPNSVPEPSTLALLGSATLGAWAMLRRRRTR